MLNCYNRILLILQKIQLYLPNISRGTASPFAIVDESGSFTHYIFGADSSEIRSGGRTNGQAFQNLDGSYIEAQAVATPVPFGVSTDLSIIILGSLYGASRLRKKLAANK